MKLSQYLTAAKQTPTAFAAAIGVPPSTITRLLKNERSPGLELMAKIKAATKGKVKPDDFLPAPEQPRVGAA